MVKFNHNEGAMYAAFGITEERADILSAVTFYELIHKQMLLKELFDKPEEAPCNLTSKTGILEAVYEDCENEAERLFITFEQGKHEERMRLNEKYEHAFIIAVLSLYMQADKDKETFINMYIKHKRDVQGGLDKN